MISVQTGNNLSPSETSAPHSGGAGALQPDSWPRKRDKALFIHLFNLYFTRQNIKDKTLMYSLGLAKYM